MTPGLRRLVRYLGLTAAVPAAIVVLHGWWLPHAGTKVLVSGPSGTYGHCGSELTIAFAVNKGYIFLRSPNSARSAPRRAGPSFQQSVVTEFFKPVAERVEL